MQQNPVFEGTKTHSTKSLTKRFPAVRFLGLVHSRSGNPGWWDLKLSSGWSWAHHDFDRKKIPEKRLNGWKLLNSTQLGKGNTCSHEQISVLDDHWLTKWRANEGGWAQSSSKPSNFWVPARKKIAGFTWVFTWTGWTFSVNKKPKQWFETCPEI